MKKQFISELVSGLDGIKIDIQKNTNDMFKYNGKQFKYFAQEESVRDFLNDYYPIFGRMELDSVWESFRADSLETNKWFQKAFLKHRLVNLQNLEDFHDGGYSKKFKKDNNLEKVIALKNIISQIGRVSGWNQKLNKISTYPDLCRGIIKFSTVDIKLTNHEKYISIDVIDTSKRISQNEKQKIQIDQILDDLYNWLAEIKLFLSVSISKKDRLLKLTIREESKMLMKSPLDYDSEIKHRLDAKTNELKSEISRIETQKVKIIDEYDAKIIALKQSLKSIDDVKNLIL